MDSANFINSLIKSKPTKRLGYNGISEVRNHQWFKDFDWEALKNRTMISPFKISSVNGGKNFNNEHVNNTEWKDIEELAVL